LALLPAVGQSLPVVVDLVLVGAGDLEGDRLAEGELRPAVEWLIAEEGVVGV